MPRKTVNRNGDEDVRSVVYIVCIARLNVYLPDELAAAITPLGWNLSHVLQGAVREQLATIRLNAWLRELNPPAMTKAVHRQTLAALEATNQERASG